MNIKKLLLVMPPLVFFMLFMRVIAKQKFGIKIMKRALLQLYVPMKLNKVIFAHNII